MRFIALAVLTAVSTAAMAGDEPKPSAVALIDAAIADIDSHRALMTRVSIPARFTLPRHYHPTEEFLYVASGNTILRIDGKADQHLSAGMAFKIPATAVHTAITETEAAEVIVFRIHPNGQPIRIPVKDTSND